MMKDQVSAIYEKVDNMHEKMIVMMADLGTIKNEAIKTNGRIKKLEVTNEENIRKHAVYEERLSQHMDADEKEDRLRRETEEKIFVKISSLSKTVWIGVGIMMVVSILFPIFMDKITG